MGITPQIELGNLGMTDSLILMVLALVVFGPRRLPQIGRQLGKLMYEFRKASNDFKFQMEEELRLAEEADRRKKEEAQRQQLAASQPEQQPVALAPVTPAIDSPYPGEAVYPPPVGTTVETPSEETLHLQPPSTGKTVSATAVEQVSEAPGKTAGDSAPVTETVTRNG